MVLKMNTIKNILDLIAEQAKSRDIDKIILFGSRARGDNKPKSDIDIAVYGNLDYREKAAFYSYVNDEMETLLKFDIVFVNENTSDELIQNINKDGVVVYEKI